MTSPIVEQVARALCEAAGQKWVSEAEDEGGAFLLNRIYFVIQARAAIAATLAAIREPGDAAIMAGNLCYHEMLSGESSTQGAPGQLIWQAIVDHLIKETGE